MSTYREAAQEFKRGVEINNALLAAKPRLSKMQGLWCCFGYDKGMPIVGYADNPFSAYRLWLKTAMLRSGWLT